MLVYIIEWHPEVNVCGHDGWLESKSETLWTLNALANTVFYFK